jgi:calcium-dependent protein kinase
MIRALKVIPKSKLQKEGEEKLIEETTILSQMDHPNIVKLFEIFNDENAYYLISQYCDGGELFDKIRNIGQLTEK